MNPSPAPLTHKLILGTLLLIFVCLALLVLKVYWPGWMRRDPGPAATVSGSDSPELNRGDGDGQVGHSDPTNMVRRRVGPTNQLAFSPARVARTSSEITPDEPVISAPESKPIVEINDARRTLAPIVVNQAILPANEATGSRGEIVGRVTLSGTPPPEVPIDLGPMCGPLHPGPPPTTRHYVVNQDGGLANVLLFVFRPPQSGPGSREGFLALDSPGVMQANNELVGQRLAGSVAAPPTPALIDQVGCMFEPYITAVQVSQPISIRNSDPVLHNIHATPHLNREFNFGQPVKGSVNLKNFDRPEVFIRLKCDVHQWMFAYVSVLAHPFFSVTDEEGVYHIPSGLKPGRYRLAAVHLKTGTIYRDVTVDSTGASRADVEFRITSTPRQTSNRRP